MRRIRRSIWLPPIAVAAVMAAWSASGSQNGSTVHLVHPDGPVPSADPSSLTGRIAYSTRAGDIWVMKADGNRRIRITRSSAGHDFDPSWAPDAKALVFRT